MRSYDLNDLNDTSDPMDDGEVAAFLNPPMEDDGYHTKIGHGCHITIPHRWTDDDSGDSELELGESGRSGMSPLNFS